MKPSTNIKSITVNATAERSAPKLDLALSAINKQFGAGSIVRLGASSALDVEFLPTGNIAIDYALGGGLPIGRCIECYGPESSGKTTFCLTVIKEAQKRGEVCAIVDVEHSLDPAYSRTVGVDVDKLLVAQPDSGEEALSIVESLARSGEVKVIVLDSVAALVSQQELDGQMGDSAMGSQARLMGQAMRRLTAAVSNGKCICIFTNQIREKIGVMFGSPETTPGGKALKFFASMRIDIRKREPIKTPEGVVIGNRTKIKTVKNKVFPAFREAEFDIMYDEGISNMGSLVDLAIEHKVLEKKAAWISFEGDLVGQGRDAAKLALKTNSTLAALIQQRLVEKMPRITKIQATAAEPIAFTPQPAMQGEVMANQVGPNESDCPDDLDGPDA